MGIGILLMIYENSLITYVDSINIIELNKPVQKKIFPVSLCFQFMSIFFLWLFCMVKGDYEKI